MALTIGQQLGSYEIIALLGKGGMGEVYRARDLKLKRDVAIKVLTIELSEDLQNLSRFRREAEVLASLNHPHIATIYHVDEAAGRQVLILELVEGETLADRIARGPLPLRESLAIATQITEAIDAAHEKGIIHRDLKPANVKITPAGLVKVLDFGIAKISTGPGLHSSEMSTITSSGTQTGAILGTAAYMSPEQARGKPVDKRTDIWSFGCVLWEMLTGQLAFHGETISDTIAAILHDEVDWRRLPNTVSPGVRTLLRRCLQKDPQRRLRDIGDARLELESALTDGTQLKPSSHQAAHHSWQFVLVGIILLLVAFLAIRSFTAQHRTESATVRFNLSRENSTIRINGLPHPSPDGTALVYPGSDSQGRQMLWLRELDSENVVALPGTEAARQPFWSPDGRWIAFYAQGKLKKVSRDGASVQTITSLPDFFGGSWSSRGEILLLPGNRSGIFRVPDSGGTLRQLTKLDASRTENSHRHITFLPDGDHFLFVARCSNREYNSLYSGSLDSGAVRVVGHMESNVAYVPADGTHDAMLLFAKDGKLFQQRFDGEQLRGEPVPIMDVNYNSVGISGDFALSANARVLLTRPPFSAETALRWVDRSGKAVGMLGTPGTYIEPSISPDGKSVIFNRPDDNGGNRDIWSIDTQRGIASRLTVTLANEWSPVWAPDGRRLIFASDRGGNTVGSIFEKTSLEPGAGEAAVAGLPEFANPWDWSPDGRWIAFSDGGTHNGIWVMPTFGNKTFFRFMETPFEERTPKFSPDSKWIAYQSNESGRFEVYVRGFSGKPAEASAGKIQISERGGYFPRWSKDGKELFFIAPDSQLYRVDVTGLGRTSTVAAAIPLFTVCPGNTPTGDAVQGQTYDVAHDGRFLFVCGNEAQDHYSVFANWKPKL